MAETDIRAAIKAILETVVTTATVHDYRRWAPRWSEFLSLFKDSNDKIHGWMITNRQAIATRDTDPTLRRQHEYLLIGIYGLDDSAGTEKTFRAEVENIQNTFDPLWTLNSTTGVIDSGPLSLTVFEPRVFGTVLCHYAELKLPVWERKMYT